MALVGAGLKAVACGNIGIPFSEIVASRELWDVVVIEVSSFQLETIRTFRPQIAVWLNLTPNHLDRYPSMEEYRSAKLRIFENQKEGDWAVVPSGETMPKNKSRPMTFGVGDQADLSLHGTMITHRGKVLLDMDSIKLRGNHNALNLMAAFACGLILGADPGRMAAAIAGYTPPAHRCELVFEGRGVKWINDSKATTLAAMEQAIRSVRGPLLLIAGGKDKGFTFDPIAPLVRERVDLAILIGEMRHRIATDWASTPTIIAESLDEAVEIAAQKAPPGGTILFSPGTSSFDMFRDYIDRGESFRRLVQNSENAVISTS
jgi:UDP-N-acetylmuramoylalanine--D-glutamate ligase